MIRKLRKKFIGITAVALLALILTVLVAVNLFFALQSNRILEDNLKSLMNMHPPAGPRIGEDPGSEPGTDRTFGPLNTEGRPDGRLDRRFSGALIFLDEEGNVLSLGQSFEGQYDEAEMRQLSLEVFSKGKRTGFYRYYKYLMEPDHAEDTEEAYRIAVINASNELYSVFRILIISLVTAVLTYGIVLFVIVRASERAVRPMAESYEKQKRFITDAGHELKTPLSVISANNEVSKLTFGENEVFDTIDRQVTRMNALIRSLMELSRMDEEQKPEFAPFSLSDALYDTFSSFRNVAESKGKTFTCDIEEGISFVGDESKIRQLAAILADNGVKYCDEGGEILSSLSESAGRIRIRVENDYADVDKIDPKLLFERFYRADEARSYDGSYGLGLSIARSIVNLHGGTIEACGKEGNRIRFEAVFKTSL